MRIPRMILMATALACLTVPTGALAKGGSGGGTPTPTPTPSPTGAVTVAGVTVSPAKVAYNTTATGTVRLSRVPDAPTTVGISNDSFNSPVLAITPDSVTVTPPASSASFPIQGGTGLDGRTFLVRVTGLLGGTAATGSFHLVPFANTDLIRIPLAQISQSGDIKVQATTDTASAVLTASFNGANIPMRNKGNGQWEGTAKVPVAGGDVVVRSNLGGCQARSPFSSGADHFC